MTDQPLLDLDVNGQAPDLAGSICEAILLSQFLQSGVLVEPANVIYLKFDGDWYRLYFDCGIVFWRISPEAPEPWVDTEEDWQSPLFDLGQEAGVIGSKLGYYSMTSIQGGSSVEFVFTDGKRVLFKDTNDHTTYHVI